MGKDIELHDEMRTNDGGSNALRNFAHLRPPTSSSTLATGRVQIDGSFETQDGALREVNYAVKNVFVSFDERKWASTLLKVVRHMRLMERAKYLEPHYSVYALPIARYVAAKFKLGSAFSSYSNSQVSGNNRDSSNGANWKQHAGMDVVLEEDQQQLDGVDGG